MITPHQFPRIVVVDSAAVLTPWDVVGMFYRDARGNRGKVLNRFDTQSYRVLEFHRDGTEETRLRGINWIRTMRFFETREQCEAPGLEAFERGQVMGSAGK